jgi:hypothetical protein
MTSSSFVVHRGPSTIITIWKSVGLQCFSSPKLVSCHQPGTKLELATVFALQSLTFMLQSADIQSADGHHNQPAPVSLIKRVLHAHKVLAMISRSRSNLTSASHPKTCSEVGKVHPIFRLIPYFRRQRHGYCNVVALHTSRCVPILPADSPRRTAATTYVLFRVQLVQRCNTTPVQHQGVSQHR